MKENVIIAYKNLGETPLECLELVRLSRKISQNTKMTYAGRLDPMAEGVLLLLLGEECKNKEKYLGLDKTYEFEILVGFSTDTHDLLGLVTSSLDKISGPRVKSPDAKILSSDSLLKHFIGLVVQKYPKFSSKTIDGKPLFRLSRQGKFESGQPEHQVTIYELKFEENRKISKENLEKEITRRIGLVSGDFRQEEIKKSWQTALEKSIEENYKIIKLTCKCSSGTYIRQLTEDIGREVGLPLVTFSIKRTQIGLYTLDGIF